MFEIKKVPQFINNEFLELAGEPQHVTSSFSEVFSSLATESDFIYSYVSAGPLEVVKALQAAQKAFLAWKDSTYSERLQWIEKIEHEFTKNKNLFITTMAFEQGLTFDFIERADYKLALEAFQQIKKELLEEINKISTRPSESESPTKQALGVQVVVLSRHLTTRQFVQNVVASVAAGNSVIVKWPSDASQGLPLWGNVILNSQSIAGLIQGLVTTQKATQKILITHPSVKAVLVNGTLATGHAVLKDVAEVSLLSFKKIKVNSGAKNSVFCSADFLDQTAEATSEEKMQNVLDTFLYGQGQLHWNSSRLFVLEKNENIWKQFILEILNKLKPVLHPSENGAWTPLRSLKNKQQHEQVSSQVSADQGKLIQAKTQHKSFALHALPFFTQDMSKCSTLQQDQILSPAFILSAVKYPFDMPKTSNVSYYGAFAHLFGQPHSLLKLAHQLEVGEVYFNSWSIDFVNKHSGVKQSSWGFSEQENLVFNSFHIQNKKFY